METNPNTVTNTQIMNSIPCRIQNMARVCGGKEVIMLPQRALFSPLIFPFLKPGKSQTDGEDHTQVLHSYNLTWANERCIKLGGELVLSLPLGYNKYMDEIIRDQGGVTGAADYFFKRGRVRQWENVVRTRPWRAPFPSPTSMQMA